MLAQKSPQVQKAVVRLMELSQDERTRMLYESRKLMEGDIRGLQTVARQEGRQEGMLTVARNLLKMQMPVDEIMAATGLSCEEVESLRN